MRGGSYKMRTILLAIIIFGITTLWGQPSQKLWQAGQTPYLERKITISFDHETVGSSLQRLSVAGGFVFSYNPDVLDAGKVITYRFVNRSVREILDEIFKGSIQYKARGQYLILTSAPKTSSRKEPAVVSGYVVDESTGERLKDVSIYDPITLASTVTDSYGYFEIEIDKPPSEIILSVNREYYSDTLLSVSDERRLLNVSIRASKDKLAVLADSVNQKVTRLWHKKVTWFHNINMRNIDDSLYRTFQVSLVPFVGTNHKMSAHVTNDYSLNVVGGYSLGVRKMEFGGVFNMVRGNVKGVQVAGVFNGVSGDVEGFQLAGVFNGNGGAVRGAQIAGVLNLNVGNADGFALGGVGNIAAGPQSPAQIGGVFNIAAVRGGPLQIGGVFNVAASDMKGMQTAGVFNIAGKQIKGTQLAGVFNIAGQEIRGAQISGVFNVARSVCGVQIGLINIADSVKGIPIGLMSVVGKGYHKIEISADEIFYNNIAFRSGVRQFYNIFQAGARPSTYRDKSTLWTFGYGVGSSARISKKLFLDFDLTSNQIVEGNSIEALNLLNKVYIGFDYQAFKKLSISMGATLNGLITETDYDGYPTLFTDYQPNILLDRGVGDNHALQMWIGAKVGIRFL